jgi:hypothetical protein
MDALSALRAVLGEIEVGEDLHGYGICELVYQHLWRGAANGRWATPSFYRADDAFHDWVTAYLLERYLWDWVAPRGAWAPERIQLLKDARAAFGVAV